MEGLITRIIADLYTVRVAGREIETKARGKLRLGESPLSGDRVKIKEYDGQYVIDEILPRKNFLIRPPLANIDQLIAVIAPVPAPNFALIDRILIWAEYWHIDALIVINKEDLGDLEPIYDYFSLSNYPIITTCALSGRGIDELIEHCQNKVNVLAGQSGVGKSSIINAVRPEVEAETGEISARRGFGRHITRVVSLISLPGEGYLADTPGFNRLDLPPVESIEVSSLFPEIHQWTAECRFRDCLHRTEPGCAVMEALEQGKILSERYQSYLRILEDVEKRR